MRRVVTPACFVVCIGLLACALPASAGFTLSVPEIYLDRSSQARQVNVDVYFSDIDRPTADNRLAGFAVRLDIQGGGKVHFPSEKPNGIALTPGDPDPYVFLKAHLDEEGFAVPARPAIPSNSEAYGPQTITVFALSDIGSEAEIGIGQGVVRVPVIVEPDAPEGYYALTLDPLVTSLANASGVPLPTALDNGFIYAVPEPASLGLPLTVGSALLLRRRPRRFPALSDID